MRSRLFFFSLLALLAAGQTALAETKTYSVTGGNGGTNAEFYAQFTDGSTTSDRVSWTYNSTAEISFNLGTNLALTLSETNKHLVIRNNATGDAIGGQGATTLTVSGNNYYYIYHVRLLTADGNVIQLDANGNAVNQGGVSECDYWNMTKSFSHTFANGILFSKIEVSYATAIPITDAVISGIDNSYVVSDTPVKPVPTAVTWHGTTLTKDTHYTLYWNHSSSAGTAAVNAIGKGIFSTSSSASKDYTLVWATYNVRFNKNSDDANGTMSDQAFTYSTAQALTANAFTRIGYTFDGWSTTANGAVVYTDGQSVSNLTATDGATVDLYAQWTPLTVTYIDGNGQEQSITYPDFTIIQSGSYQTLGTSANAEAWYVVIGEVNTPGTLDFWDLSSHLIVCDGATLTASSANEGINCSYSLTIYGQSSGTGRIVARNTTNSTYAIRSSGDITINGGSVDASGKYGIWAGTAVTINGGTVTATGSIYGIWAYTSSTLGWRNASDRITASSYSSGIVVKSGQALSDGTAAYSGTLTGDEKNAIAGKTLQPCFGLTLPEHVTASGTGVFNKSNGCYALPGATVTLSASEGYAISSSSYNDGSDHAITGNSFTMPAANVTVSVSLAKDFTQCTATVPDPEYHQGYYHGYFYDGTWNSNHGGIEVRDANDNLLTYYHYDSATGDFVGDYEYTGLTSLDGGNCETLGERCRVTLEGRGEWSGVLTADVVIVDPASASGTWGDLSWSLANGMLTISGTGAMNAAANNAGYPWYQHASYIIGIEIGEGVTSIAASAFAGTQNENPYAGVVSVSFPSTLTSIGDYAFAYCTSLDIDLDHGYISKVNAENIGTGAFNQINLLSGTLYVSSDNTAKIGLLSQAAKADVKINNLTLDRRKWYTMCLPFSVSNQEGSFQGAELMEIDMEGTYEGRKTGLDNGTYYLYFKPVTEITAGKPFLVQVALGDNHVIRFEGVRVDGARTDAVSSDGKVKFMGSYARSSDNNSHCTFATSGASDPILSSKAIIDAFGAYIQLTDAGISGLDSEYHDVSDVVAKCLTLTGTIGPATEALTGAYSDGFYWATFYDGTIRYTLPEGATAYTMDSYHHLYRLGTDGRTIPAGVAVVIISDKESITLTRTADTSEITINGSGNILRGSDYGDYIPSLSGTPYVLGVVNGVLGFREYAPTNSHKVPAHKAFYVQ